MSEDTANSQKTEEPSWRKLDEARRKGQVPQSREVTNWFIVLGATASMALFAPSIATAMQSAMFRFIEQSAELRLDSSFREAAIATIAALGQTMGPAGLILMRPPLPRPGLPTTRICPCGSTRA